MNKRRRSAYGARGGADAGRFSFTGQITIPELGLLHYKARAYNTAIGRFMQTDPVGYDDQMNLYAYVGNDPVNATDPSGKTCTTDGGKYECKIDDPGGASKEQVGKLTTAYTDAVKKAAAYGDKSVTISVNCKSFTATGAQVAAALAKAKVAVSSSLRDKGAQMETRGGKMDQYRLGGITTFVLPTAGDTNPGKKDETGRRYNPTRAFIHESFHMLPQEKVMQNVANFDESHGAPYSEQAEKIRSGD